MTTPRSGTRDDSPGVDARAASLFIVYLKELSLDAWVEAARWRALVPRMADAERTLQTVIRQMQAERDVFATKEAVLDALQRFESAEGRRLTRTSYATEHLRAASERAALAVLVRSRLTDDDFGILYAPFERVIPSALLFGLQK
jgi:hypothetical protein